MIEKKKYDLLSSKNIFGFERLPGCLFCWIPPPPPSFAVSAVALSPRLWPNPYILQLPRRCPAAVASETRCMGVACVHHGTLLVLL